MKIIEVNKRMSYDEAKKCFGGKTVFMNIISARTDSASTIPEMVYIYWVIENPKDEQAADKAVNAGVSGIKRTISIS